MFKAPESPLFIFANRIAGKDSQSTPRFRQESCSKLAAKFGARMPITEKLFISYVKTDFVTMEAPESQHRTCVPQANSMTLVKRRKILDPEKLFLEAERYEESGDFSSAFKSLLAGAKLGHSSCQVNLGNFYASGKGTRRSLRRAAHWYKRAYKNGDSGAASNLAIDRRNAGNIRSAVIWFKKAIALDDAEACIPLAKIYMTRKGGQKAAIALLRQALRINRNCISESGREEAESLLKEWAAMRR